MCLELLIKIYRPALALHCTLPELNILVLPGFLLVADFHHAFSFLGS
jgi:hypothetical protein